MGTRRNAASTASCVIMSWVRGSSVTRSSPLYCILIAKLAALASFARFPTWCDAPRCPASSGWVCEFRSGRPSVRCMSLPCPERGVGTWSRRGSFRRRETSPLLKVGRRRLIPNLEQVTCSESTVTPINSAISSRLLLRATRFFICWIRSGVNFTGLSRLWVVMWSAPIWVIAAPYVHSFLSPAACCLSVLFSRHIRCRHGCAWPELMIRLARLKTCRKE